MIARDQRVVHAVVLAPSSGPGVAVLHLQQVHTGWQEVVEGLVAVRQPGHGFGG
jgi:hypothetical protein